MSLGSACRIGLCAAVLLTAVAPGGMAQVNPFKGSQKAQGLNGRDVQLLSEAADSLNRSGTVHVGDKKEWSNPDSGNSGLVTATRIFTSAGLNCHALRYDLIYKVKRPSRTYNVNWCKIPSGEWKIKS